MTSSGADLKSIINKYSDMVNQNLSFEELDTLRREYLLALDKYENVLTVTDILNNVVDSSKLGDFLSSRHCL